MRKLLGIMFVVLAILASAVPASAQAICWGCIPGDTLEDVYYVVRGNNVGLVTAGNLRMVRDLTGQLPRSLGPDLVMNGGYYGIQTPYGFHPMGRREAAITYGAIGAGIGYGVSGNLRGSAIGAASGAIVGLLTHRGKNNNQRDNGVIVTPPSGQQGVYVGTRPNGNRQGSVSNPPSVVGDWRISNRTSKKAEVWDEVRDPERPVYVLGPGQSLQVPPPQDPNGYKAVLVYSNPRGGGLIQENAQIRGNDNFNGWDIVAPVVQ